MNDFLLILFYALAFVATVISLVAIVVAGLFWKQDVEEMKTYPKEVDWLLSMEEYPL